MIQLRGYQDGGLGRIETNFENDIRRVLGVLPTGGGKTVIAAELMRRFAARGVPSIFLAHRREIIKQTYAKLVQAGLDARDVGVIMAGVGYKTVDDIAPPARELSQDRLWEIYARRRPMARVHVASVDTLRNHTPPSGVGLVVVDEAHRAAAKGYQDIQKKFPSAYHLGLTATPERADRKPLRSEYDEIVVMATYMDLVELGSLVVPRCYGAKRKIDMTGVRRSGGDYRLEDLSKAVDRSELVGDIVEHWLEHGNNAPTFCFAVDRAHARHLAERFRAAGVTAVFVDGETETAERDAAIAGLRSGAIKVVCNCNVFTEGTDVPEVKTIILANPTLSVSKYLQSAGRGSRPFGDIPFTILDHAGSCTHPDLGGLPHADRAWSLDGRRSNSGGPSIAPTRECKSCRAILPIAYRSCPECDYEFPIAAETPAKTLKEKEGKLELLTDKQAARLADWDDEVHAWRLRNAGRMRRGEPLRSPGEVLFEWRRRTNATWQPKGSKMPTFTPEEIAYNEAPRPTPKPAALSLIEWTL